MRPRDNGAGWLTCGDSEIVHGEIALRDRHRRHPHVAADDDDARAFVDDDLGGGVRLDLQLFDLGQHGDDVLREFLRQRELHGRRVERFGDRRADIIVDGDGDALGRREVGVAQGKPQLADAVEREFDLALDDGAVRHSPDGRNAARDLGGLALGRETADGERALRDRIDIAVGAEQRRDQQRAALQAFGIAHRRGGHVDPGALGGERRQIGGDHDGGDVAGADLLAADIDAKPFQHRLQGLLGERRIVERIAGAVEADDEAIAEQLVLPDTLDTGEVFDARRRHGRRTGTADSHQRGKRGAKRPSHLLLPKRSDILLPKRSDRS